MAHVGASMVGFFEGKIGVLGYLGKVHFGYPSTASWWIELEPVGEEEKLFSPYKLVGMQQLMFLKEVLEGEP